MLHGSRDYEYDIGDIDTRVTTSVMLAAKYAMPVSDMLEIYAGGGLGGLYYADIDNPGEEPWSEGWGIGYELKAGAAAKITENIRLVGEFRYIDSFGPIQSVDPDDSDQMPTSAILVGINVGM